MMTDEQIEFPDHILVRSYDVVDGKMIETGQKACYPSNCPFSIIDPDHYRDNETCKCDDVDEQQKMCDEWDYTMDDIESALCSRGRETKGAIFEIDFMEE